MGGGLYLSSPEHSDHVPRISQKNIGTYFLSKQDLVDLNSYSTFRRPIKLSTHYLGILHVHSHMISAHGACFRKTYFVLRRGRLLFEIFDLFVVKTCFCGLDILWPWHFMMVLLHHVDCRLKNLYRKIIYWFKTCKCETEGLKVHNFYLNVEERFN